MENLHKERPLLEAKGISKFFGGLAALQGVDLEVNRGEILGLIGPNGAGKTTLFNIISGNIRQDQGEIYFEAQNCNRLKPFERCRLGIARTYQSVRPFLDFSIEQNVIIGQRYGCGKNALLNSDFDKDGKKILKLLGLESKKYELTKNLTLVDRKLVEVARALATHPKLLLLDEVLSGLNPVELEKAVKLIKEISVSFNITIIWIEHIMQALIAICDRFVVLNYGTKLLEGEPLEVVANEKVVEAYLGRTGKRLITRMGQS